MNFNIDLRDAILFFVGYSRVELIDELFFTCYMMQSDGKEKELDEIKNESKGIENLINNTIMPNSPILLAKISKDDLTNYLNFDYDKYVQRMISKYLCHPDKFYFGEYFVPGNEAVIEYAKKNSEEVLRLICEDEINKYAKILVGANDEDLAEYDLIYSTKLKEVAMRHYYPNYEPKFLKFCEKKGLINYKIKQDCLKFIEEANAETLKNLKYVLDIYCSDNESEDEDLDDKKVDVLSSHPATARFLKISHSEEYDLRSRMISEENYKKILKYAKENDNPIFEYLNNLPYQYSGLPHDEKRETQEPEQLCVSNVIIKAREDLQQMKNRVNERLIKLNKEKDN